MCSMQARPVNITAKGSDVAPAEENNIYCLNEEDDGGWVMSEYCRRQAEHHGWRSGWSETDRVNYLIVERKFQYKGRC